MLLYLPSSLLLSLLSTPSIYYWLSPVSKESVYESPILINSIHPYLWETANRWVWKGFSYINLNFSACFIIFNPYHLLFNFYHGERRQWNLIKSSWPAHSRTTLETWKWNLTAWHLPCFLSPCGSLQATMLKANYQPNNSFFSFLLYSIENKPKTQFFYLVGGIVGEEEIVTW